jgi:dihydroorotate dehydrogenase (fumarate)
MSVQPDLRTKYLGLELSGPVIASAGPATRSVESMIGLERAGAAAVVLPSLFQEEVEAEEANAQRLRDEGDGIAEFTSAPLPEDGLELAGPGRQLQLVQDAKQALKIPVIASLNATRPGDWASYAKLLADAGADALELNLYDLNADPALDSAGLEQRYLSCVGAVKQATSLPLAVKISNQFASIPAFAGRVEHAGASGLVLFNRFFGADIDLESLTVTDKLELSTPSELRTPLRWCGILRPQRPKLGLALTSGVDTWADVAKAMLVGADVACTTSAVIRRGPVAITQMLDGLTRWLDINDYESLSQLRGSMSMGSVDDPEAYVRAQYVKAITD